MGAHQSRVAESIEENESSYRSMKKVKRDRQTSTVGEIPQATLSNLNHGGTLPSRQSFAEVLRNGHNGKDNVVQ